MAYNKNNNYCSYSPDKLFGVNFNYACYLHDRKYYNQDCTRKEADIKLRDNIFKYFIVADKKHIGFLVSRIYYLFVRMFGWIFW